MQLERKYSNSKLKSNLKPKFRDRTRKEGGWILQILRPHTQARQEFFKQIGLMGAERMTFTSAIKGRVTTLCTHAIRSAP